MAPELFMISELAERAQTTIRTIRYYTDEGLLPLPISQGKYAYYTAEHLNRLELIRSMKDSFLPLRQIKQAMNSITDDEVRQKLTEIPTTFSDSNPENTPRMIKESGGDALDYIAKIMQQQVDYQPKPMRSAHQASIPRNERQPTPALAPSPTDLPTSLTSKENWMRISFASGIELHLREPVSPETSQRIQQLIEFAKRLF